MLNKTSATLMLQTIMVLMDQHNTTDVTKFPLQFTEDAELERCYDQFGCFSKAYPWTENRPDNYFPEPPESMYVRFPAFTRRNRRLPVMLTAEDRDEIANANFDSAGPFFFIAHGFLEGGDKSWIQQMCNALLNLEGNAAATVIVVDWRGGAQPPYGQATANIRLVGVMLAHLIHNIYEILGLQNLDNFHYIGHSLGAHLGGYCGHELQKKFNLKLGRITGLDPAAPYFTDTVSLVRLDRSDAKYVDVIHSNAMPLYYGGFGISEPIGHVDFYPNGGAVQPGCSKSTAIPAAVGDDMYRYIVKSVGCNHERSFELFTESIAPLCPMLAIQCESYEAFLEGSCGSCGGRQICAPLGYHSRRTMARLPPSATPSPPARLYLTTGSTSPYCRMQYIIELKVANHSASVSHGPDVGRFSLALIDRNNNKTTYKMLDDEQRYYKPGDVFRRALGVAGTGLPPAAAALDWRYEMNLFSPITWRLVKSSAVYVEYLKIISLEYNTEITVCPKMNKPVVANLPTVLKPKYCNRN